MANEAYRKVISMIDNTVNNAGDLLQRLPALQSEQSMNGNNASCTSNKPQSKEIDDKDCTTAPDQSDRPSPVARTPPYSRSRSLSGRRERKRVCAGGNQRRTCSCTRPYPRPCRPSSRSRPRPTRRQRSSSQVKIMHADNIYISCDSDGLSIAMSGASRHSQRNQRQKSETEIEHDSDTAEFESRSARSPKTLAKRPSRRTANKNEKTEEESEVVAQASDHDATPLTSPKRVAKKLARSSTPRKDETEKGSKISDFESTSARSPKKLGKRVVKKAAPKDKPEIDDSRIAELSSSTPSPKQVAKKLTRRHDQMLTPGGSGTTEIGKCSSSSTRSPKRTTKKLARSSHTKIAANEKGSEISDFESTSARSPRKLDKKLAKKAASRNKSEIDDSRIAELSSSTRPPKQVAKKLIRRHDPILTTSGSELTGIGNCKDSSTQSPRRIAKKSSKKASPRKGEVPGGSEMPEYGSSIAESLKKANRKLAKKAITRNESDAKGSQAGNLGSSTRCLKGIAKKSPQRVSPKKEALDDLKLVKVDSSSPQSSRKVAKKVTKTAISSGASDIGDFQIGESGSSAQSPKKPVKKSLRRASSRKKESAGESEHSEFDSSIAKSPRKASKKLARKAIPRNESGTKEGSQMAEFGSLRRSAERIVRKSPIRTRTTKEEYPKGSIALEVGSSSQTKVAKRKVKTATSGKSKSEKLMKSSEKRTPTVASPRRKSLSRTSRTSTTTEKKAKSYLKETVTRTIITTTKEVPEGREAALKDPSKGVVKKREVKTTTTTKLYSDKSPSTPLPKSVTKRTFTRVLLPSSKPAVTSTNGNDVLLALKAAMESKLAAFQPPLKPKDPYRPPKTLLSAVKGIKAPTQVPTVTTVGYANVKKSSAPTYVGKSPKGIVIGTPMKKSASLSRSSDRSSTLESIKMAKTYSSKWAPVPGKKPQKYQKPTPTWSPFKKQPDSASSHTKPQKFASSPETKPKSPKRKAATPKERHGSGSFLEPAVTAKTHSSRKSTFAKKRLVSNKSLLNLPSEKKHSSYNSSVKVLKLDMSSLDSSKSSRRAKRKNSSSKPESSDLSESISTARANTPIKRSFSSKKKSLPPKKLLPWGLSSAENPIEKPEREKAQSPQITLSFSSSHSSLLGKPVHRRSPPSARWRKKKDKEAFKPAMVSESYLERQLNFAIAGRKITPSQKGQKIRSARDKIVESRKSMKEQDAKQRASGTFKNPVTPRYLKPKYKVPDEVKIEREESDESSWRSSKRKKSRISRNRSKRGSSCTDDQSVRTARAFTPDRRRSRTPLKKKPESPPRKLLPWGLTSAENPIEPRKHEKKASPQNILQYNSSHSSLLGRAVHRCSPPSSKHHRHQHKKKHSDNFNEAGVSESYLDHQIQLSIGGPKSTTRKVKKARDSIRESRKAMKEQDKERRSTQKFSNPVTPKYLKPKYAIPPELQVRREPFEDIDMSSKSVQTEPPSTLSDMSSSKGSTMSDGVVCASEKAKKSKKKKKRVSKMSKEKKKAGYRKERPTVDPDTSESYRSPHINQFAIAGRKVRRKTSPEILEKVENIRKSREQIRESRKAMKRFDAGPRLSKEFTHNPGKAPNLHSIKKKQAELASRLSLDPSAAVDIESRTAVVMDHSVPPSPPLPKIGKRFQRKDKAELWKRSPSRSRRARERKKRGELRPAAPSKSWLEHSLKFADDGRKAWSRAQHEARTPQGFKKRSKAKRSVSKSGSERSRGSDTTDEDVSTAKDSISMDEQDSSKKERRSRYRQEARGRSPTRASSKRLQRRSSSSRTDLSDKELNTARSSTPRKSSKRAKGAPCWRCSKCNATITPSMANKCRDVVQESPLSLTSAGHSERTSAPNNTTAYEERRKTSPRQVNNKQLADVSTARGPDSDRAPCSRLSNKPLDDVKFDAKFHLRDVDSNMEHTLVINGYFLDKNLKRLTLNGRFCKI